MLLVIAASFCANALLVHSGENVHLSKNYEKCHLRKNTMSVKLDNLT